MATYKRPSRKPLLFFSDKLARLDIHRTLRSETLIEGLPAKIKIWYGSNAQDKETMIVALWIERPHKLVPRPNILETEFGYICPNCNTNEFLRYRTQNMTISNREATRFNREEHGMFCELCNAVTERRDNA